MGAAVFCTYFFVAHPPASRAPVTMQVVARKAFIRVSNLVTELSNHDANAVKHRSFNDMTQFEGPGGERDSCNVYVIVRFLQGIRSHNCKDDERKDAIRSAVRGRASAVNGALSAGATKARQIPSRVLVDLTFRIEVQRPKLALAHIFSRFCAGGHCYYSIG